MSSSTSLPPESPSPPAPPDTIQPADLPLVFTPDGRIDCDLLCTECSYNLRTLTMEATCPECGMTVVTSARRDHLINTPEHFRASLWDGARLFKLSVLVAFPLIYPGVALSGLGVWFLTRKQPGRVEPAFDRGYRLAARWLTVFSAVMLTALTFGALIAFMGDTRRMVFGNWTYNGLPIYDLVFLVSHAVYVLGIFATWRYLRILALRVPQPQLAQTFYRLGHAWLLTVLMLAGVCCATYGLNYVGVLPGVSNAPMMTTSIVLVFMAALIGLWVATLRVVTTQAITFKHLAGPGVNAESMGHGQG